MLKIYCRITGILLLALGVAGILNIGIPTALSLNEPAEIGLHLLLGLLACVAGFTGGAYGGLASLYARVIGVVYIVLAVVGFVIPDIIPGLIHLDPVCNFTHLILGLWGTFVGFWGQIASPQPRTPIASAGA